MEAAAAPESSARAARSQHELRYVARAGLLPELSAQTYNSFYKALREVVLNAIDASATRVDIDFSRVADSGEIVVTDDGRGMTVQEFNDHFMSVGGSPNFGNAGTFGRIGIGSLALLHYGSAATVETKPTGTSDWTVARIAHPWQMNLEGRRGALGDLAAGWATVMPFDGNRREHFTRLRIHEVRDEVREIANDPVAFYGLLDRLRRVLPLRWADCRLVDALRQIDAETVDALEQHTTEWAVDVFAHSAWERDVLLTRRFYGDGAEKERWSGVPRVLSKRMRVPDASGSRDVMLCGFLLQQFKVLPSWSGLTARVQNVAVEEGTFFDVVSDAGFRKYITGEIYLFGDVDQDRLINIDRSSFNRECRDYGVVQRYMARELQEFKSQAVQASQRRKVAVRQALTQRVETLQSIARVSAAAEQVTPWRRLPSSRNGRIRGKPTVTLRNELRKLGATLKLVRRPDGREPFGLTLDEGATKIVASVAETLANPRVRFRDVDYAITFIEGSGRAAPVLIKNRPREIVFDANHPAHGAEHGDPKYHLSLALEMAHLLSEDCEESLYEMMLAFVAAL